MTNERKLILFVLTLSQGHKEKSYYTNALLNNDFHLEDFYKLERMEILHKSFNSGISDDDEEECYQVNTFRAKQFLEYNFPI